MKHEINKELSESDIENLIKQWVVGFKAERNRAIMRLRLIEGLTFEQIAERMDMSVRGVVKIIYHWLDVLSRHV